MAHYSYKDVCYSVPSHFEETFKERHGRDFDEDPNYNGDYWIIVGEWIESLEKQIEELTKNA
jgi:hypothetical protein